MSPPGKVWNEESLPEHPAIGQLVALGYSFIAAETLEAERESLKEVVLTKRLAKALKRLNPWLSDDNVHKAVRAVTAVQATSLIEASQEAYATLTLGKSFDQDRGDGKKSYDVRYVDFDTPANNELVVTLRYKVKGATKHIIPDVVLLVNGIPVAIVECKSPTLGEGWKAEALDQFSRYQELEARYRELGAPKLFETMQVLIATCGQAAVYGTVTTPHRFYAEWKRPYPKTLDQLESELGRKPLAQDVLFDGMLRPRGVAGPRAELHRFRAGRGHRSDDPHLLHVAERDDRGGVQGDVGLVRLVANKGHALRAPCTQRAKERLDSHPEFARKRGLTPHCRQRQQHPAGVSAPLHIPIGLVRGRPQRRAKKATAAH
jgi:hypothetical protein